MELGHCRVPLEIKLKCYTRGQCVVQKGIEQSATYLSFMEEGQGRNRDYPCVLHQLAVDGIGNGQGEFLQ